MDKGRGWAIVDRKLWFLWRKAKTGQYYHVGNLIFGDEEYGFSYETTENKFSLKDALNDGYPMHSSFPEIGQVYKLDRLFNCFDRRLPNFKRRDVQENYSKVGVSASTDKYKVLLINGGRIEGDTCEFVEPIKYNGKDYIFDFYVRGWIYFSDESFDLSENEMLYFEVDTDNEYEPDAIKVMCKNKALGYVPGFYSAVMRNLIVNNEEIIIDKYEYDKDAPLLLKVSVRIGGKVFKSEINEYREIIDSKNVGE